MGIINCKYCNEPFDNSKRASSTICYNCMPAGLTPSQQHTIKRKLDREKNPIILCCPSCKENFILPFGEVNRKYCYNCMPKNLSKNEQTAKARLMGKKHALEIIGDKCYLCGFNKYSSALEFHHINGDEDKNFNLSNNFTGYELNEKILAELDKCITLCSNCHKALHANELNITVEELREQILQEKNNG